MADWSQVQIDPSGFAPTAQDEDSHGQVFGVELGGAGGGITLSFKMRALQDPGPGYEVWVVTGSPDFAGASAGGPIQPGTAIIADQWET